MADDSWEKELAKLSPEARRRVEQSLKAGLAAELASEALSPEARLAEFSRGWFFSRSKPSSLQEEEVMRNSLAMDDDAFKKFASRLTQLKSIKDSSAKQG
jgi:hypothetical protein